MKEIVKQKQEKAMENVGEDMNVFEFEESGEDD